MIPPNKSEPRHARPMRVETAEPTPFNVKVFLTVHVAAVVLIGVAAVAFGSMAADTPQLELRPIGHSHEAHAVTLPPPVVAPPQPQAHHVLADAQWLERSRAQDTPAPWQESRDARR